MKRPSRHGRGLGGIPMCLAALVSLCTAPYGTEASPPAQDTSILRTVVEARPQAAVIGEQITYQAWVYSTSDITETMHITATVEPFQMLAVAGTVVNSDMGPADCDATLFHLACRINIKRWYPASIFAVIDAPNLTSCDQRVSLRVIADLPNRHSEQVLPVQITGGTRCYYFPMVLYGPIGIHQN